VEKLASERVYLRLAEKTGIDVRIARFHNIYGPECAWRGGREKAPAALCRKVAEARRDGTNRIEVWGDGEQTRSFCHIEDCLEMLYRMMASDYDEPLNIGTDRAVSVNELIDIIGPGVGRDYDLSKPQGVRGRNADLTRMIEVLGYEPRIALEDGMRELYRWIEGELWK
jgi:GDP-D-mannose 3',5'-epimerase